MFNFVRFLKGLLITNEVDPTKQMNIQVSTGATTGTSTSLIVSQTANRSLVFPDASDTLVGRATTDTLTNKTVDADLNTISNIDNNEIKALAGIDATKIADGSVSNAEFQTLNGVSGVIVTENGTQTLTNKTIDADLNTISNIDNNEIKAAAGIDATKIADGTVSNAEFQALNGVSGTIVDTNSVQVLTNKTIDADANTITNIENADIKVGAAIARTKLASGSANHVIINDGSGVLSSEAQLAITRGGTGQATANAALNALLPTQSGHSGEFLTTDGSNTSWATASGGSSTGSFANVGLVGSNNTTTPATQFDVSATSVTVRNSSNQTVTIFNTGTITNDITVSGPTANGRDSVTAPNNQWRHLYWIWDGATLATVNSTVAPPTGPTLPSGYTHWSYIGAFYYSTAYYQVLLRGSWVYNNDVEDDAGTLTSTSATNQSLSALIPPNGLSYNINYIGMINSTAGGLAEMIIRIFDTVLTSNIVLQLDGNLSGLAATTVTYVFSGQANLPVTLSAGSAVMRYQIIVSSGTSPGVRLKICGYRIPNGGE